MVPLQARIKTTPRVRRGAEGAIPVKFLSDNIDHTAFACLGTRGSNEVVDDEDWRP